MKLVIFDPQPARHDYLSPCYFAPMHAYAARNGINLTDSVVLTDVNNSTVCCLADYLEPDVVSMLKNNGNKIVGFSVTDSSYISQCCREAGNLKKIDLMFMLTGIQKVNHGHEMILDGDMKVVLERRQFLPEEDWEMFHSMHQAGKLQSLPYVHAERQVDIPAQPYSKRSQKALIRGGHHMRRFLLALALMKIDRLDINSGFVTEPYFKESMNPQFRYCGHCRSTWNKHHMYPVGQMTVGECANPNCLSMDLSDLGQWNNKCPQSFYKVAMCMGAPMAQVEKLMNARWLAQREHLEMLARITFTSDLKWLFSIYAAQRFWDAAMVGCVNLLPSRTADQEYFPAMQDGVHYLTFTEQLTGLGPESEISETLYDLVSKEAKALYDSYMRPTDYAIGTPILKHIFNKINEHAT